MRYSQIRRMDISDGPGIRVSLFVQGCNRHCHGCFNEETWDFSGGKPWTHIEEDLLLKELNGQYVTGLSILGGEPLSRGNLEAVTAIINRVRSELPSKTIWLWTGYTVDELDELQLKTVKLCDVVVDGPFIESKKDLSLQYCGSTNQRVINTRIL